ncbi:MAG: polysaccharide biosynthesis tyrosine autokinase [Bryobacteraceae bacterium]|jgi:capsular exopolysaccharide synthesis family protein
MDETTFVGADRDLMHRAKPAEIPAFKVQVLPPPEPERKAPPVPKSPGLREYWHVVLRRKWLLLGIAVGCGLVGLIIGLLQTPVYEARTALEDSDPAALVETQTRILKDEGFVEKVLVQLGASRRLDAGYVLQNLTVHAASGSHIIDIGFEASDPEFAADFPNALASALIEESMHARSEAARNAAESMGRQLGELKANYQLSASELQNVSQAQADLAALQASYEAAKSTAQPEILDRLKNEYETAERRASVNAANYDVLKREVDTNRATYETALQKQKEAEMDAAARAGNMGVISAARRPVHATSPRPLWNAGVGTLCGLLLGLAFVFVREKTDRSLRAPGDISTYLNLPEFGAIPSAELDPVQPLARHKDWAIDIGPKREGESGQVEMASCSNETSRMAESFRSALASLWFAGQTGKRPRVFVLTSPSAREGKTTLTSNLGIALANTNRRVLVIDGDIRKPRLHTIFNVSNHWGLGNLLEDDCPIEDYLFEDIVWRASVPGLYVLPAGTGDVNVSSLRYHERLTDLLMRFRLEFHAVLLDTPPMLEFSDARILGRLSDGVILVVRASETSRDDAAAVYRRFQEDGTPVLGSILNDWNPRKSKRGYGYRTSGN